jgi:DNA repair protein RadC
MGAGGDRPATVSCPPERGADAPYNRAVPGELPGGYRTMREMAEDDRPREKLLALGGEVLSDAELVAVLLGSGMRGTNVVDLSRHILESLGGLGGLVRADTDTLQEAKGLGPARAALLAAAVELGRRMQQLGPEARPLLVSSAAVYAHFVGRCVGKTQEELYVCSLDMKGRLLGAPDMVHGTVNAVPVRPLDVFRGAIVKRATQIVMVHNHPSGDPRPSAADVATTKEMIAVSKLLEVEVVDHVIIGAGKYVSLRDSGYAFRDKK